MASRGVMAEVLCLAENRSIDEWMPHSDRGASPFPDNVRVF